MQNGSEEEMQKNASGHASMLGGCTENTEQRERRHSTILSLDSTTIYFVSELAPLAINEAAILFDQRPVIIDSYARWVSDK